MLTATQLYAGVTTGPHRCFFCGGPADERFPTSKHVRDTFTAQDTCAVFGSAWVCGSCVEAMRSDAAVTMHDGTQRADQKPWQWSWCLTERGAVGYACCLFLGGDLVKAHAPLVRQLCLAPPVPPYVLVLAGAGRTHQLYMARVNYSRESVSLLLDGERIDYAPAALAERLQLTTRLCAAIGKPALEERPGARQWIALADRYGDATFAGAWQSAWSEPLSRLAVFLTPNKEASGLEYPASAAAQAH